MDRHILLFPPPPFSSFRSLLAPSGLPLPSIMPLFSLSQQRNVSSLDFTAYTPPHLTALDAQYRRPSRFSPIKPQPPQLQPVPARRQFSPIPFTQSDHELRDSVNDVSDAASSQAPDDAGHPHQDRSLQGSSEMGHSEGSPSPAAHVATRSMRGNSEGAHGLSKRNLQCLAKLVAFE